MNDDLMGRVIAGGTELTEKTRPGPIHMLRADTACECGYQARSSIYENYDYARSVASIPKPFCSHESLELNNDKTRPMTLNASLYICLPHQSVVSDSAVRIQHQNNRAIICMFVTGTVGRWATSCYSVRCGCLRPLSNVNDNSQRSFNAIRLWDGNYQVKSKLNSSKTLNLTACRALDSFGRINSTPVRSGG